MPSRRRTLDRAFAAVTGLAAGVSLTVLALIVATVLWRSLPALDWRLVTEASGIELGTGGVRDQLLGSVILITTALTVAVPISLGWALVQTVFVKSAAWRARLRRMLYGLNAVPSILFGIFGLIVFVRFLDWGKSWLAGGILLGFMMLPTVTVAWLERIEALPQRYLSAAAALGLKPTQIITSVILPQTWSGGASGALLGLARAAGETAPIMFTAAVFSGAAWPDGIRENPVLALPYHIFVLAQDSFDPAVKSHLWASALVLLVLVLSMSLMALPLRLRAKEEAHHG